MTEFAMCCLCREDITSYPCADHKSYKCGELDEIELAHIECAKKDNAENCPDPEVQFWNWGQLGKIGVYTELGQQIGRPFNTTEGAQAWAAQCYIRDPIIAPFPRPENWTQYLQSVADTVISSLKA